MKLDLHNNSRHRLRLILAIGSLIWAMCFWVAVYNDRHGYPVVAGLIAVALLAMALTLP